MSNKWTRNLSTRGIGRFQLGDSVTWRSSSLTPYHFGTIVEVVKYNLYPTIAKNEKEILKTRKMQKEDIDWPELVRAAYYRDHESYIIEDAKGKRWWPRVGNLKLLTHKGE